MTKIREMELDMDAAQTLDALDDLKTAIEESSEWAFGDETTDSRYLQALKSAMVYLAYLEEKEHKGGNTL